MISDKYYEIAPLTLKRLKRTYKIVGKAIQPGLTLMDRLQAGMMRVVLEACPKLKKKALKNADLAEVQAAFERILKIWGLDTSRKGAQG